MKVEVTRRQVEEGGPWIVSYRGPCEDHRIMEERVARIYAEACAKIKQAPARTAALRSGKRATAKAG